MRTLNWGILCMTPYSGCVERLASYPTCLVGAAGMDSEAQPHRCGWPWCPRTRLAHLRLSRCQALEPQLPGQSRSYVPLSPAVLVEGAARPVQASRPTELPAPSSRADAQKRG